MTNNFDKYKQYITEYFNNSQLPENDMYFAVELMRRGKDNPNLSAANYHFKNYYIRKPEDLDKYKQEIIDLCSIFRMRAYASVCYKSFRQVSLNTMAELARRVANNDFKKNYNVYESCSGSYFHSKNKRWIIDLDDCDIDSDKVNKCKEIIKTCKPYDKEKIVDIFKTKSGVHLITIPFDIEEFELVYSGVFDNEIPDIKKNHLTLLYENL
jgi:hypothetical protein